uniref:Uncharacterized protein n=1 Tax=Anguilla anguilla TaxID=7936 RepID=A0A0E9Q7C5_ANGAN
MKHLRDVSDFKACFCLSLKMKYICTALGD